MTEKEKIKVEEKKNTNLIKYCSQNKLGSFYGKFGYYGTNRSSNPIDLGKANYESINIAMKLKELGKGSKVQIRRPDPLSAQTPAQYYPNPEVVMPSTQTHKFSKSIRTSAVLASALSKDYQVEMGDSSFALIKSNVAPGYYEARPMTTSCDLGFFPKAKRMDSASFSNQEPGPGSYNLKENPPARGFLITHAKDTQDVSNEARRLGPGRYAVSHHLVDKKVQGFSYDDHTRKNRSKNGTIAFLREKYSTEDKRGVKKSKAEIIKLVHESIDRHANRSMVLHRESIERNEKIGTVRSESVRIENERKEKLEYYSKVKQTRKKLLHYENENDLLTALVKMAIREKIRQNFHQEILAYKDQKSKVDNTKRFLIKNRGTLKTTIDYKANVRKNESLQVSQEVKSMNFEEFSKEFKKTKKKSSENGDRNENHEIKENLRYK